MPGGAMLVHCLANGTHVPPVLTIPPSLAGWQQQASAGRQSAFMMQPTVRVPVEVVLDEEELDTLTPDDELDELDEPVTQTPFWQVPPVHGVPLSGW